MLLTIIEPTTATLLIALGVGPRHRGPSCILCRGYNFEPSSTRLPVRDDLEASGAEIAIDRREQEMRGNSQLLRSRNPFVVRHWLIHGETP